MKEIIITDKECGGRLDKAVIRYLDKAPRNFIYKMLRKKNIVLNDKKATGSEILAEGDVVRFYLADETIVKFRSQVNDPKPVRSFSGRKQSSSLQQMIIYEDDNVIALNKPSGMLSQRSESGGKCLNDLLVEYLGKGEMFTPGISNRLDRNTSGIILAGKNPRSVRLLNESIKNRDLKKHYLAVVCGKMDHDLDLEGYIIKDHETNKSVVYGLSSDNSPDTQSKQDKRAYIRTSCRVISVNNKCSLLDVDLITGRSHQIRAQLSASGHGIIGDIKYGDARTNEYFRKKYGVESQLLHAYEVRFDNMPGILDYLNGKTIRAKLTEDMKKTIKGENLCLPGDQGGFGVPNLNS